MKLSCVIPAWNEAESLPHFWEQLRPVLQNYPDWEVIFVSDGSTDQTGPIIQAWEKTEPRIKSVILPRNQGKSRALMAGFAIAAGDVIVTLDADLQDDPAEIPNMIAPILDGRTDMVGGWKKDRHDPLIKKISSKVFNGVANQIMGANFHDLNSGLKAYRAEVAKQLDLYGDLYRFIPLLAMAAGWRVLEIPVKHHARQYGVSKYGLRINGLFDLVSLLVIVKYRWRPLHFFGRWGGVFVMIGVAILIYLSIVHFAGERIGDRPLLIFGALFVLGGLQFIFTGLLADLIVQQRGDRK